MRAIDDVSRAVQYILVNHLYEDKDMAFNDIQPSLTPEKDKAFREWMEASIEHDEEDDAADFAVRTLVSEIQKIDSFTEGSQQMVYALARTIIETEDRKKILNRLAPQELYVLLVLKICDAMQTK